MVNDIVIYQVNSRKKWKNKIFMFFQFNHPFLSSGGSAKPTGISCLGSYYPHHMQQVCYSETLCPMASSSLERRAATNNC